jgi:hypothetical protein
MIFSTVFQLKRSLLHIQCKFSSLLGLNGAFSARKDMRKYHQMDERSSLFILFDDCCIRLSKDSKIAKCKTSGKKNFFF